jgi:hypothetical protein
MEGNHNMNPRLLLSSVVAAIIVAAVLGVTPAGQTMLRHIGLLAACNSPNC